MAAYTAVLSRAPTDVEKNDGPGCCPICCTLFSVFAALFLFVVAAAMKNHYHYLNIEGACRQYPTTAAELAQHEKFPRVLTMAVMAGVSFIRACPLCTPASHAGDLNELSKGVTYAGLVYLVFALIAMFFWVRGVVRTSRSQYQNVA